MWNDRFSFQRSGGLGALFLAEKVVMALTRPSLESMVTSARCSRAPSRFRFQIALELKSPMMTVGCARISLR